MTSYHRAVNLSKSEIQEIIDGNITTFPSKTRDWLKYPETALAFAILKDALRIISGNYLIHLKGKHYKPDLRITKQNQLLQETLEWFCDTGISEYCFSFQNICAILHLDPEGVLRGLSKQGLIAQDGNDTIVEMKIAALLDQIFEH